MKRTNIILLLLGPLMLTSSVLAQKGDWQVVKNLPPGTRISVKIRRFLANQRYFRSATGEELVCERVPRGRRRMIIPPIPNEDGYERSKVRRVHLEQGEVINGLAGAGIGAGIGATLGASGGNGSMTRGGSALLIGGIGALVGGMYGSTGGTVIHGKDIYRR